MSQIDARENSGSISINTGVADKPQLAVVWERRRGGGLMVRARYVGGAALAVEELQALFDGVNEQCRSGALEDVYRRWHLEYHGLPWRGEFWLEDTLRLGPPSRHFKGGVSEPRAIVVDALVGCIGAGDAVWAFDKQLQELAAFLSVVLGRYVYVTRQGRRAWTWTLSPDGTVECSVRNVAYWITSTRLRCQRGVRAAP